MDFSTDHHSSGEMAAPSRQLNNEMSMSSLYRMLLHDNASAKRNQPRLHPRKVSRHGLESIEFLQQLPPTIHRDASGRLSDDKLCRYCSRVSSSALGAAAVSPWLKVSDALGGHHHSPSALDASAASGCAVCWLFLQSFKERGLWTDLLASSNRTVQQSTSARGRFKLWARNGDVWDVMSSIERCTELQYLVLAWIEEDYAKDNVAEVMICADVFSAASIHGGITTDEAKPVVCEHALNDSAHIIKEEWRNCHENHSLCSSTWSLDNQAPIEDSVEGICQPTRLPTRVVVADYASYNREHPFLLETNGLSETYATLSHCWGSTNVVRTTYKNIEAHREKIQFGVESQTFLDAIDACRALSIKYLWIDSLCIIQYDSTDPDSNLDDWEREARKMGSIYKNAALTIAATGASDDPSMGLFHASRDRVRTHVRIPYRRTPSTDPEGFMTVSPVPRAFDDEVADSQLYTRGWVLQERVLSTRYLHFGRDQWFWQCRTLGHQQIDLLAGYSMPIGADMGLLQRVSKGPDEFNGWWMDLVETYSRLSFTVKTDRIIALEGLIKEIQRITRKPAAGGIWTESLHHQLLWLPLFTKHPAEFKNPGPPRLQATAPSWSWLSSSYPIHFPNGMNFNLPDSLSIPKSRVIARFRWKFMILEAMARFKPEPGEAPEPSRMMKTSFLAFAAQMKTILIDLNADGGARTTKAIQSILFRDRHGPLLVMASGYNEYQMFGFNLLDPKLPINASQSKVGSCYIYDGMNTDHIFGASQPRETMSFLECIRISDNMVSLDGQEQETVQSYNVLLLKKISNGIPQLGNLKHYAKAGVGIIHVAGWFDFSDKPSAFIIS